VAIVVVCGLVIHTPGVSALSDCGQRTTEPDTDCQVRFHTQGRVFNGPTHPPTEITLTPLDANLAPLDTGGEHTTGHDLDGYVLFADALDVPATLTATTALVHPLTGEASAGTLQLKALTSLARVNHIHPVTTLEIPRVRALHAQGAALADAKAQALSEWAAALGATFETDNASAIDMTGTHGAPLAALTAALSTAPNGEPRSLTAQQALLDTWAADLADTGTLADTHRKTLAQSAQAARPHATTLSERIAAATNQPTPTAAELDDALGEVIAANTHDVTIQTTGPGHTTPAADVRVLPGQTQAIALQPATGHRVQGVTGDCPGELSAERTRFETTPTQDCTLEVAFVPQTHTVTVEMNEPGAVDPTSPIAVEHGQTLALEITPPAGFDGLLVAGCNGVLAAQTYTITGVAGDCTIEVEFFERFFIDDNGWTVRCPRVAVGETGVLGGVTYTKRDRDTITPANAATACISGETDLSDLFAQATGFNADIHHWDTRAVVDMDRLFADASAFNQDLSPWCVANIPTPPTDFDAGARAWAADNARPQWGVACEQLTEAVTLTASSTPGGELSSEGEVVMRFGQRKRFTVSADPGYALVGVTGCGGALSGESYLTDNLTDDCSVVASFSAFYRQDNGVTIACPQAAVGATGIVDGVTYTKRAQADLTPANAATSCITGVTDLGGVFKNEANFNGDISHWDVSAVTTMLELFSGAEDFNQDIGAWQTDEVTNMDFMFYQTKHFNQDLSGWCVEKIAVAFSFSSGNNAWTEPKPLFGQPCAAP
jgi:hypothetical protein